jgi:hypothetical protein
MYQETVIDVFNVLLQHFVNSSMAHCRLKNGVQLPKNIIHEDWLLNYETGFALADFHRCVAKVNTPKLR